MFLEDTFHPIYLGSFMGTAGTLYLSLGMISKDSSCSSGKSFELSVSVEGKAI